VPVDIRHYDRKVKARSLPASPRVLHIQMVDLRKEPPVELIGEVDVATGTREYT
jgi:hypothetical protein